MFGGVTHLNLDPKNRVAIPAKYRELLEEDERTLSLVITLESSNCLLLYPIDKWDVVHQKIQNLPNSLHPLVKSYQRLVLGHAELIELDKSGRILIPGSLKDMVQLNKEVVLVGMGNRFELWDKLGWQEETRKALEAKAEDLASLLNGVII